MDDPRLTNNVTRVLIALLNASEDRVYGLDLAGRTGIRVGTLYPILDRLLTAGWVHDEWEDVEPAAVGRPRRRYYRLTPDGVIVAVNARADLEAILAPRLPGTTL